MEGLMPSSAAKSCFFIVHYLLNCTVELLNPAQTAPTRESGRAELPFTRTVRGVPTGGPMLWLPPRLPAHARESGGGVRNVRNVTNWIAPLVPHVPHVNHGTPARTRSEEHTSELQSPL